MEIKDLDLAIKSLDSLQTREEIVTAFSPLIYKYAKKCLKRNSIDLDDIVQEGRIGLLTALDRFEPNRSSLELIKYIKSYVQGYIHHIGYHRRSTENAINVSMQDIKFADSESDGCEFGANILDPFQNVFKYVEKRDLIDKIKEFVQKDNIDKFEKKVLVDYFFAEKTFDIIAKETNYTKAGIRAVLMRAIRQLKTSLEYCSC